MFWSIFSSCHDFIPFLFLSFFFQIEFYFGDANLTKDRFLRRKVQENKDGGKLILDLYVHIATCHIIITYTTWYSPAGV